MPLRDDLLNPIPGANPSGENLKYAPVYDKIKEARRQDDDAPQGDWQRERKLADYTAVLKLAGDALATKSKDLQLAAWITEAALNKEGFPGLLAGLKLIRGLIEKFWDTLYPELEDGESELRSMPLEWVGTRLDEPIKNAALTRGKYGFFKYKESRTVPSEDDAAENETRAEARTNAIAEGKLTPEAFEKDFSSTPKAFYVQLVADLDATLAEIEELNPLCEEKFGEFNPSFSKLRTSLEEVRHTANGLLQKKRELEPDAPQEAVEESEAEPAAAEETSSEPEAAPVRAARPVSRKVSSVEPVDREDAVSRVVAVATFLRTEDPYNPTPYLLLRGLRWGELRAAGTSLDANVLDAPATSVRQQLKRLANEGSWTELLEAAEGAMGQPCGRGWLDLQRHVVRACEEIGSYYDPIATAVKSELRALLADYPDLRSATLTDDTPAANSETQTWLSTIVEATALAAAASATAYAPAYEPEPQGSEELGEATVDSFTLAMQAAKSGRHQEAIETMTSEISRQVSGRGRFQRKLQLAQICISLGHEPISRSILEELAGNIDRHQLEEWESPEMVAHALALLYDCMQKLEGDQVEKQKIYSRICRLDPMQALAHKR
jgi:type VI secretion system protein ImpA